MELHLVDCKKLKPEVFQVFGERNALLTAGDRNHCNTMTIGWCQLGRLWNLPVCTVYVRPERYTFSFMEEQDTFSVSILPAGQQRVMAYCGSKSGQDVDKFKECSLSVRYGAGETPVIEQAELVLVCKKLFVQDMNPSCAKDERVNRCYTPEQGGWHRAYVGEVLEAYTR